MGRSREHYSVYAAWVLVALVLLNVHLHATESVYCMTGVTLAAEPKARVFSPRDRIRFSVVLTNRIQTIETISVVPDDFPFGFELEKRLPSGCWYSLGGMMPARGQLRDSLVTGNPKWIEIHPGDTYTQEVDLTNFVRAAKDGNQPGNVQVLQQASKCDKAISNPNLLGKGDLYRAKFWHDGVKATDIRGNKPGRWGCVTAQTIVEFAVNPAKSGAGKHHDTAVAENCKPTAENNADIQSPSETVEWDPVTIWDGPNPTEPLALFIVGAVLSALVAVIVMRVRTVRRNSKQ